MHVFKEHKYNRQWENIEIEQPGETMRQNNASKSWLYSITVWQSLDDVND